MKILPTLEAIAQTSALAASAILAAIESVDLSEHFRREYGDLTVGIIEQWRAEVDEKLGEVVADFLASE